MKTRNAMSVTLLGILLASTLGWAQLPTGSIVGIVYDRTGAVLPGAQVSLRDMQTAATRVTKTSSAGYYEFALLRPSTYEVTAQASGFRRLIQRDIVVHAGLVVSLDLTLEVGEVAQTVEVRGEMSLVESAKTTISTAVDLRSIKSLPRRDASSWTWP